MISVDVVVVASYFKAQPDCLPLGRWPIFCPIRSHWQGRLRQLCFVQRLFMMNINLYHVDGHWLTRTLLRLHTVVCRPFESLSVTSLDESLERFREYWFIGSHQWIQIMPATDYA